MKKIKNTVAPIFIVVAIILNSCTAVQNTNKTQRGAAIGAAAGAVAGALLGKNNRALGALIGGAVGGGAGALIGRRMDKQAEKIEQALPGAEVVRSEEGIQLILDENSNVTFEYNKSSLTYEAKTNLDKLITIFNEYPDTNILIIGHTDSKGSDEYNMSLSQKRAHSVAAYLESKAIVSSRIATEGQGELAPRCTNETDEGRACNRRVEFAITANEQMIEEAKEEAGE